ncbi:hypothetical protein OK349_15440 [Sphingomonas sp. BT-65]|uniref:hypothetical protein n=1 Tax=Sphingomonas sp. BT-65 TaxID=2989821 RepID=UPI002236768B|nr:hypothetical protein [Sphingomonas sp. BT-65]MCW4463107.1 hypothetical protein [Sphingomonas sp. BT-65]
MASPRSKTIWDASIALSTYVVREAVRKSDDGPFVATSSAWQILEYLMRFADSFFGEECIPDQVRDDIKRGRLIATGIRDLPSRSTGPVRIPPDQFLTGRFRLLCDVVESSEFRYDHVRLIEKSALSEALIIDRPNQRTRRNRIAETIRQLAKSGNLDGKLRKQQIPIARDALEKAGIENIGTDKTIERLIRDYSGDLIAK